MRIKQVSNRKTCKSIADDNAVLAMSHFVIFTAPMNSNVTFMEKVMTHFDAKYAT